MAQIYARWIQNGRMTIDAVPVHWRDATAALLPGAKEADAQ